ncbi:Os10g0462500, partial [Oryza sativa Japonica Group]
PAAWNFSSRGGGGATKTRRRGRRAARGAIRRRRRRHGAHLRPPSSLRLWEEGSLRGCWFKY